MKKLIALCLFSIASLAFSQETAKPKYAPPAGKALVGDTYGAQVSAKAEKKAISVDKLQTKLKKSQKINNVAVKGKVVDVCEKKGCWLTVETPNKEQFFVKMKDYAFFVPTSLKGKNVVLEGNAEMKTISVVEQQHYAEDAKKSEAEIAAITKPKDEIRFMADGIKVVQ